MSRHMLASWTRFLLLCLSLLAFVLSRRDNKLTAFKQRYDRPSLQDSRIHGLYAPTSISALYTKPGPRQLASWRRGSAWKGSGVAPLSRGFCKRRGRHLKKFVCYIYKQLVQRPNDYGDAF
ncbi:Hypothetical_protein [Hexamita inflata]|uniref:Hypothetical_protein n=1 Tax=Hexamita inflata TaxID=28002 RepID=A0AA86P1M7_9EUKA|nr:Hypothetical protein HINF_LOCUS18612 [Hexamita inflata]